MIRRLLALCALSIAACDRGSSTHTQPADASVSSSGSPLVTIARVPAFSARIAAARALVRDGDRLVTAQRTWSQRAAIPTVANAPLRLGRIDIAADDCEPTEGVLDGRGVVFADARPSTDVVMLATGDVIEELRVLRSNNAPTSARYRIRGAGSVRVASARLEILDATGVVRITTEDAFAIDARGERRALSWDVESDGDAWIATASLDAHGMTYPIVVDPSWLLGPTPTRVGSGYQPYVTKLPSGKIAIFTSSYQPALFDATTESWTTGQNVVRSFLQPWGVPLSTGKVLLGGSGYTVAELWTESGGGVATGAPSVSRGGGETQPVHIDAGLPEERVFLFGGRSGYGSVTHYSSAERYHVGTGTFAYVATMPEPRVAASAIQLPGTRKILIAGGFNGSTGLSSALLYDINNDAYEPTSPMPFVQRMARPVVLPSGKIMLIGGESALSIAMEKTTIFDPSTKSFSAGPSMAYTHRDYGLVQLSASRFMVVGGSGKLPGTTGSEAALSIVETYDATANAWTTDVPMNVPRSYTAAALLSGGRVLATHGTSGSGSYEIYVPDPIACTTSSTDCTCVDGYCCDSPCTGQCQACDVVGKKGICTTISGEAPHGTRPACSPTLLCAPGGVCAATCSSDAACATTAWCSSGTCVPKKSNGAGCAAGNECTSGVCADGVCCDRACSGQCEACDASGSVGTCSNVTGAPHGARAACTGGYGCSGTGACATSCTTDAQCAASNHCSGGACVLKGSIGDSCTSASGCVSDHCVDGRCCDTACTGTCEACDVAGSIGKCTNVASGPPRAPKTCGAYATCSSGACSTTCSSDVDCSTGSYCLLGACVSKKSNAASCGTAGECASGVCAAGICCDRACDGECESCGTGTCSPRAGTESCGLAGCAGAAMVSRGTCSGVDNTCKLGSVTPCPNGLKCANATSCKTACATSDDCVSGACSEGVCITAWDGGVPDSGPTPIADAPAPTLPTTPVVGDFQRCNKPSDCATGFCVEGVCCDSACGDRCHSCALLTSPGKCTEEPTGVDLKNECGPANTCLGTCGPGGACIGAGTGTMCARNRCVGPTQGVGSAYCAAPGATCPTSESVPFDCAPYLCEPAFGACRSQCASSSDCANGYVCDVPSKTCVAPPPPPEDSGCATSRSSSASSAVLLGLAVISAVARRRRDSHTGGVRSGH